ncbi:hypothetical protein [Gillisia sp. JM1]|uniref:hypothetical protein n=1 Tax=Gillisia sp. JM1 TaxID=1283286 RepID=UPI00047CD04A|nr:hypothetical protein [Gillisia sp. JM1]
MLKLEHQKAAMEDLFLTYKTHIIYAIIVITIVALLLIGTSLFYKWLVKHDHKKFPRVKPTTLNLVKRIFNALWLILDLIALSFVFVERDKDAFNLKNLELVLYKCSDYSHSCCCSNYKYVV